MGIYTCVHLYICVHIYIYIYVFTAPYPPPDYLPHFHQHHVCVAISAPEIWSLSSQQFFFSFHLLWWWRKKKKVTLSWPENQRYLHEAQQTLQPESEPAGRRRLCPPAPRVACTQCKVHHVKGVKRTLERRWRREDSGQLEPRQLLLFTGPTWRTSQGASAICIKRLQIIQKH